VALFTYFFFFVTSFFFFVFVVEPPHPHLDIVFSPLHSKLQQPYLTSFPQFPQRSTENCTSTGVNRTIFMGIETTKYFKMKAVLYEEQRR